MSHIKYPISYVILYLTCNSWNAVAILSGNLSEGWEPENGRVGPSVKGAWWFANDLRPVWGPMWWCFSMFWPLEGIQQEMTCGYIWWMYIWMFDLYVTLWISSWLKVSNTSKQCTMTWWTVPWVFVSNTQLRGNLVLISERLVGEMLCKWKK